MCGFQNYCQWTVNEINGFNTNSSMGWTVAPPPAFNVKFLFRNTNFVSQLPTHCRRWERPLSTLPGGFYPDAYRRGIRKVEGSTVDGSPVSPSSTATNLMGRTSPARCKACMPGMRTVTVRVVAFAGSSLALTG